MTKAEFLIQLDEIMNRDPGTTMDGEVLTDADGWDSLAMLGMIALADSEFGVRLTGKQIKDATTVDDLIAMVGGGLA